MNESNQQHNESDELRDRLVEQGLREVLGGETPPDFSQQIISALADSDPEVTIVKGHRLKKRVLGLAALAASILLLACLIWPATQAAREAASRNSAANNETSITLSDPAAGRLEGRYENLVELGAVQNEGEEFSVELRSKDKMESLAWSQDGVVRPIESNVESLQVEFETPELGIPSPSADPWRKLQPS